MIYLHGFLGEPADWARFPDGCFWSYSLPKAGEFVGAIEELALEIQAKCGPGPHRVMGYSMGGRLALALTVLYPELVSELVMISASPGLDDPIERATRYAADLALAECLRHDPLPEFLNRWYAQPLFTSFRESLVYQDVVTRRLQMDVSLQAALLTTFSVGNQLSFWDRLSSITQPVTLVTGELDIKYTQIAQKMQGLNDTFKWIQLPEVGHAVLSESDWILS